MAIYYFWAFSIIKRDSEKRMGLNCAWEIKQVLIQQPHPILKTPKNGFVFYKKFHLNHAIHIMRL